MLAIERQRRILDMLLKSGAVTTVNAARALLVTEETVRRDFEKLEAEGHLFRRHGGAVRLNDSHRDLALDSRETTNVAEKKIVAGLALGQILAGDMIFFDASSTVLHLACLLPNLEVTVLTNALKVAVELARRPAVQVIMIGGTIHHNSLSCQGTLADSVLERCRVQKAFLSCRGLDTERGASEANLEQAGLKQKIMSLADQTILLADHTKMGVKSLYFFAKLKEVAVLITDRKPGSTVRQALQRSGTKLMLPKEKLI